MKIVEKNIIIDGAHLTVLSYYIKKNHVATCTIRHWKYNDTFFNFFVDENSRRKGIGSELIDYMFKKSRKSGKQALGCFVNKGNSDAIIFYFFNGFFVAKEDDKNYFMTIRLN